MHSLPEIENFLQLEPAPACVDKLDTPVMVVDLDVVESNVRKWQERCDRLQIDNRPHVKTHKSIALARYQLAAGAAGITVQKLGEAEVMAAAGMNDQLLSYNIIGDAKIERLSTLHRQIDIKVVADNAYVVDQLAQAGNATGKDLPVLVECDTGGRRNGVQSPKDAVLLAEQIDRTAGVRVKGLMAFEHAGDRIHMREYLCEAKHLFGKYGLECSTVSIGGSPDMWSDVGLDVATEYRAGTYIYNDREQLTLNACSIKDCAARVLTTVVSIPRPGYRAVLDAGSKALTSDLVGLTGYGIDIRSGQEIYAVSEEHGLLDLVGMDIQPDIGDRLMVLPNHICPAINLHDRVVVVRGHRVLGMARVDARGLIT